jgi:hypothetical protein
MTVSLCASSATDKLDLSMPVDEKFGTRLACIRSNHRGNPKKRLNERHLKTTRAVLLHEICDILHSVLSPVLQAQYAQSTNSSGAHVVTSIKINVENFLNVLAPKVLLKNR